MTIEIPQDRNSTFQPQVVKKRQKDISVIDQKILYICGIEELNGLQYLFPVKDKNGFIYSIDMIRVKFKLKSPADTEFLINMVSVSNICRVVIPFAYIDNVDILYVEMLYLLLACL